MTKNSTLFQSKWQWRTWVLLHLFATVIVISWLYPSTRAYWDQIDHATFFFLNGSIGDSSFKQLFWAITSLRAFDLVPMIFILMSLITPNIIVKTEYLRKAFLGFIILLIFMLFFRQLLDWSVNALEWDGKSPSLTLEPVIRLTELFPHWPVKDKSSQSFPGDHSIVLWLWLFFTWHFAKQPLVRMSIFALAIFFMLPRLVAGAHWVTDIMIGGLIVALITFAWCFYTPLLASMMSKLNPYWEKLISIISNRIPFLKHFAFFNPHHQNPV